MEHGKAHTDRTYVPPALALAAAALRSRAIADFCALPPPIVTVDDCNGRARTRQKDARQHTGQLVRPQHGTNTGDIHTTTKSQHLFTPTAPAPRANTHGRQAEVLY